MNDFLFSPTKQFLFPSGKILAGGKIYVFIKHTDNLATLYNDEDVEIANPVILDSNGRATVKADDTYDYKLDVYSPYDELLFTATSYLTDNFERDFAITSTDGSVDVNVSIDGYTTNWDLSVYNSIKGSTSGKLDTSAFESFYNDTYGPTVGDIYQRIDDISATVSGGKLDVTAFNLYSAGVRGELNVITGNTAALSNNTAMLSDEIIQNMNDINAVSGGLNTLNTIVIPEIRTDIIDVSGKLDAVSSSITNKLDTSSFNDFISNSYTPNMNTLFGDVGNLKSNKLDSSSFNYFVTGTYNPNISSINEQIATINSGKEDKITWSYNNDGEISAANGSALAGKGYYSKYAPYGIQATSGNLIIEGSRYPRQSLLEVSGENKVATAGIIPPVPEQNLSAVRYLVAASGSLADVSWAELPQIDTFTGVSTDSTLTGNGKDTPLGVAEVQSLTSDNTINITSANNEVILGVNSSWFNEAVNSAVTGAQGDAEVNTYVHNNSATIDVVNTTVQSDSGKWNDTYTNYSNNSASYLTAHQPISADEWNNVYDTVQTNSGSWTGGGGGSIDTIPFIVQSPLTTGISGYSAYIGIDGEAFESSAYVPFSALTDNYMSDGYVHLINGSGVYAGDASHSNYSDFATNDNNGNSLTDTTNYATEAYNTVQSNSANWGGGGTPVSGLELSAGDYITIVDDIPNSASIISVTGLATTGDLNYVSGVVGDVESLLAQL